MNRYKLSILFACILLVVFTTTLLGSSGSNPNDSDQVISDDPVQTGETKTVMLPGDVPLKLVWIPAFAGMTLGGGAGVRRN